MTKAQIEKDVPLPLAALVLIVLACAYCYLNYFRFQPEKLNQAVALLKIHSELLWITGSAVILNFSFVAVLLKRVLSFDRQGSKLAALQGERKLLSLGRAEVFSLLVAVFAYWLAQSLLDGEHFSSLILFVPVGFLQSIQAGLAANLALSVLFLSWLVFRASARVNLSLWEKHKLELPDVENGELVLGTTPGELAHGSGEEPEEWVKIPSRGVNGGVFISGSVGSGKTQGTILRYLSQILEAGEECPAILAVDPKRTFLAEAEKMIRQAGLGHKIVKISLKGNVSFNPVYIDKPLQNSNFASLAEMVRAAAVNFMGKASDSPFWDISSSVLIRNAIAYCSAQYGYFTLLDLYRTIVRASTHNLADDLKERLKIGSFNEEERFNIERSIEYIESEFSQLEDRVRTGIVATSTAFINQFQEFAASRVFCPKKENLTIQSMEEFVRDGKILLFDVNQPGLARSMGTFIKLHYEQAILNQLSELKEKKKSCTTALIIDEYQDVVTCGGGGTIGDDSFMAKARESKPAVIVATQSVSSLMDSVGSQRPALVLLQNFRTRIACHSSDLETIKLFQELIGKEDRESETHSLSETAQSAKFNLLAGGFDSQNSSLNEAVSRGVRHEDIVTGREFSRLRTFEAFAQVFDGIETRFLKLYLKPHFLHFINTKHETVLEILKGAREGWFIEKLKAFGSRFYWAAISLLFAGQVQAGLIPNACTVASSTAFSSCLELSVSGCMCGFPPHPCAMISYYVPQTFIEVWPETKTSYFTAIPGAAAQLGKVTPQPFGAEGDDDTQSFQARAIAVPLSGLIFQAMPSGGTRMEKFCFDGMSEDFGSHWQTGKSDLLQPLFLAWSVSPKACLLTGAATSITGGGGGSPSSDSAVCSFPMPNLGVLPPSSHPACNGWGTFYPRYGTYTGPASMTGALMIASRIKSLSAEVIHSLPSGVDEKWQMIYPQGSSCFREGQNVGILETVNNARETMRLANGKLKGYLFVIWNRTQACKELPMAAEAEAAALAIPAACVGFQ
jgi:Type IV secretion-system coupling protein DNA-binding domain